MSKRRSKGEGTIYQRQDGLWTAQITLPSGKRKVKYSRSQKVVKDWLLEQRETVKKGLWLSDDKITVSELLDRYYKDVAVHTLRPKTLEAYEIIIRVHLKPEIGNVKLAGLTPAHIQTLYSAKLNAGYSKRTVQYIHAVLHKALAQAMKWGLAYRNTADLVDPPRVTKRAPSVLTAAQVKYFLDFVRENRFYALYVLAVTTGMRQGELLGLYWEDIDLEKGVIHVQHTSQSLWKKGIIISEPKTEKAKRSISLSSVAIESLKQEQAKRSNASQRTNCAGLVFSTSTGRPISARNLIRDFQRVLTEANLPKIRFHDLRHTSATLLLQANVHPKIVQERLGHTRIDMTLDTYSHVIPGMQEEAAKKMDEIIG